MVFFEEHVRKKNEERASREARGGEKKQTTKHKTHVVVCVVCRVWGFNDGPKKPDI